MSANSCLRTPYICLSCSLRSTRAFRSTSRRCILPVSNRKSDTVRTFFPDFPLSSPLKKLDFASGLTAHAASASKQRRSLATDCCTDSNADLPPPPIIAGSSQTSIDLPESHINPDAGAEPISAPVKGSPHVPHTALPEGWVFRPKATKRVQKWASALLRTHVPDTNNKEWIAKAWRDDLTLNKGLERALHKLYNGQPVDKLANDAAILSRLGNGAEPSPSAVALIGSFLVAGWEGEEAIVSPLTKAEKAALKATSEVAPVSKKLPKQVSKKVPRPKAVRNVVVRKTAAKSAFRRVSTDSIHSVVEADELEISVLPRTGPAVPQLCHDLSRVLFNPGVYHLQDPRSRVYNFDPYLEKIMPVSEFDFKMIKQYITSSKDDNLRSLALQHGKKYVGSSSSMTATLAHFHYLLSQWRKLNLQNMSKGFADTLESFTVIQRSPSSIFLRYKDGVYSLDADKQYDSANILMSLGKSMEKLLTLPPTEFERYRKSSAGENSETPTEPEAYQYSHFGDIFMRGQLDAHDPRLPGTGIFDLKSRAVAAIRHQISDPEEGVGYEIKSLYGTWESFEREYFDLMRAGFLKYSLQVRIGQMDGIFTAFHNIERIFGFQYISLAEMDAALHGQPDSILGDQEFKLSLELLNQTLNRVTERFPERSVRILFDTRDLPVSGIYTNIFAEPIEETEIEAIQEAKSAAIDAFEQDLRKPERTSKNTDPLGTPLFEALEDPPPQKNTKTAKEEEKYVAKELMALQIKIQNRVDGVRVSRPVNLTESQKWTVETYFEEDTRETSKQSAYRTSRNRRKAALDLETKRQSEFYVSNLRRMAAAGIKWRKELDMANEGRGKVVLYEGKEKEQEQEECERLMGLESPVRRVRK